MYTKNNLDYNHMMVIRVVLFLLQSERFDKMEKADILEMTVNCVRQLQRQANTGKAIGSF